MQKNAEGAEGEQGERDEDNQMANGVSTKNVSYSI